MEEWYKISSGKEKLVNGIEDRMVWKNLELDKVQKVLEEHKQNMRELEWNVKSHRS